MYATSPNQSYRTSAWMTAALERLSKVVAACFIVFYYDFSRLFSIITSSSVLCLPYLLVRIAYSLEIKCFSFGLKT